MTVFWAPARALFRFGALDAQWLVVPAGAAVTVRIVLELLKPIWCIQTRTDGVRPMQISVNANSQAD